MQDSMICMLISLEQISHGLLFSWKPFFIAEITDVAIGEKLWVFKIAQNRIKANAILITDHHNCGLPLTVDAFCSQDPLQNIAFFQKQDTNKYGNT